MSAVARFQRTQPFTRLNTLFRTRFLSIKQYSTSSYYFQRSTLNTSPNVLKTDKNIVRNVHFRASPTKHPLYAKPAHLQKEETFDATIWTKEELEGVKIEHIPPRDTVEKIAFAGVKTLRFGFDVLSGYKFGPINDSKLLRRVVFLETVAGIPGMVAASLRHLKSLRRLEQDRGWLHTLLEEAENERMHALLFSQIRQSGPLFRFAILGAQGIFWNIFFFAYLLSPRLCHKFVAYLEEEAVSTYTNAIKAYDNGQLPRISSMKVPALALQYWRLPESSTMRDVLLAVRADEANHRDVNGVLSELPADAVSPF